MHKLAPLQIRVINRKPTYQLLNAEVLALGLNDVFLMKTGKGRLFFNKYGAATKYVDLTLLLADAEEGNEIMLDGGGQEDSKHKVRLLEAMRSTGVDGVPNTTGATFHIFLLKHAADAPVTPVAAAGGAGGGGPVARK